jgi:hypothetical protein
MLRFHRLQWVIVQGMMAAATSVIIYYGMILPSKKLAKNGPSSPSTNFLLGFGVILPFWLILPSYQLQLLNVRSRVMRFIIGAIVPTLSLFRTLEGTVTSSDVISQPMEMPTANSRLCTSCVDKPFTVLYQATQQNRF